MVIFPIAHYEITQIITKYDLKKKFLKGFKSETSACLSGHRKAGDFWQAKYDILLYVQE